MGGSLKACPGPATGERSRTIENMNRFFIAPWRRDALRGFYFKFTSHLFLILYRFYNEADTDNNSVTTRVKL